MTEKPKHLAHISHVDPFLGNAEKDLVVPEGIAEKWWCAKPPVGNTHPGACLPFGMVSACAYSGAYVAGYGRYGLSLSGDPPPVMYQRHEVLGIAHFQQSGTGRIRMYYNYLLTSPLGGEGLEGRRERRELLDERAWPGYYGGTFGGCGVGFEVSVTERGAKHVYHFPEGMEKAVAVDVSAGGLLEEEMGTYPQWAGMDLRDDGTVGGQVVMEGIPLQFVCRCGEPFLWEDDDELEEAGYVPGLDRQKFQPAFGFGFRKEGEGVMELEFGFFPANRGKGDFGIARGGFP